MNDDILRGYPVTDFLHSEKCAALTSETRRTYTNCLGRLREYAASHSPLTPERIVQWDQELQKKYTESGVCVHLAAANSYFKWCNRYDLVYVHKRESNRDASDSPTLTRLEYLKLLRMARSLEKQRTYLLIKLFATTDTPLQCLDQITAELVRKGYGTIHFRGNSIEFYCPKPLQKELLEYMAISGVYRGPVFVTRNGKLIGRPNIFRSIKEICQAAGVDEGKGNPRALRNLYKVSQRDIETRLAVLKHQMIDQTVALEQEVIGWEPQGPPTVPLETEISQNTAVFGTSILL